MIHVHLIVTAVILLVGAMAAIIICICVDIVPIIKSRASTLASRDSATKDQARKLKKKLIKNKLIDEARLERASRTDENKNIYESDREVVTAKVPPVTKSTATNTTSTVVVEASSFKEKERREILAAPEGDRSTQQSSTESSQTSDLSRKKHFESENERSRLITEKECRNSAPNSPEIRSKSSVAVSVHSNVPNSPSRQRSTHSRQQSSDIGRLSAPSSPNIPRGKLPMTSRPYQDDNQSQNRSDHSQKEYSRQNSAFSRSISQNSAATSTVNSHRASYRNSPGQYSEESYNTPDSSDRGTPFDYHDAPWDTKGSFLYRENPTPPCQCCYLNHLEITKNNNSEVEDFSAPLLQRGFSHSYRSDHSSADGNRYYNDDRNSDRTCSKTHRPNHCNGEDFRSQYSYNSNHTLDGPYHPSDNSSPTDQRTDRYYHHADHKTDHARSPNNRSLKEHNSPKKAESKDNELIRKHYDSKQSHTYSMPNPKHTRHHHLPSNHHLSNHKSRSPERPVANHPRSPNQDPRRHQQIGTSSLHGSGANQRYSPHSSCSSSPCSVSSGQRRRRTKLEDIQEVANLTDEEERAEIVVVVENSDKSDSPLHSCAKQSTPDVESSRCSESEDDQRRLELKRNFVLDMKAAIEGTVTDCGSKC